jgi:argininosuccinate lyase
MALPAAADMMSGVKLNKEAIAGSLERGYICATELADYLSRKNVPFREAHGIVKKIVENCHSKNMRLSDCPLRILKNFSKHFEKDALLCLSPETVVRLKISDGGTSHKSVEKQITALRKLAK